MTPAVFQCQNVTDHCPCLPRFLLPNAESKSASRTDEIRHCDCHVLNSKNNTSGRARLWDTALKFLCPGLFMTSPDHLEVVYASQNAGCQSFSRQKTLTTAYTRHLRWYACGADGRAGCRCTVKSGYSDSQMEAILGFNCLH